MSVSGIEAVSGFTPMFGTSDQVLSTSATTGVQKPAGAAGPSFEELLLDGVDRLEGLQDRADHLSVQAATGDLNAIHDYTVAATEAQVATQLTVTVRNKAVEAFNEIMRMPV